MIILASIITVFYGIIIIAFILGFDRLSRYSYKKSIPKTTFSIVIPFRNEAKQLPKLLTSLAKLNYPAELFEILFIDDDSEDNSVAVIQENLNTAIPNAQLLRNVRKSASPKKDAIETAIVQATFDWILTTDADCCVSDDWLLTLDAFIRQQNSILIAAPVTYKIKNTWVERFQLLDILSLQGATMGGFGLKKPFLCNGANLCYKKQAFFEINGFEGNEHIASGDDIFLLEKMLANYPSKVHFLKSNKAIISTNAESTLQKLISQRIRWASKTTSYNNSFSKLVSIAVFGMNLVLPLLVILYCIGFGFWQLFSLIFVIKFCLDGILLVKTAIFFRQQHILIHYFWSSLIYPIFIIFIALSSFTTKYSWKGRSYKQ